MNYQETLDYLYQQLPMFHRIGAAAYKKDLTNTLRLCEFLGNPQHSFKTIHIAGTNGKGSTSHLLAATLQLAKYKTGLYTSPHYMDFRERIKINGQMISQEFVIAFVEKIRPILEEIRPSFFEITVAMCFDYFRSEGVEVAVIETGLGGRLDSTNVISPILSVITNIGYDHMDMLGDTLAKIAGEKAGIIKPQTPVVIGERQAETDPVFTQKAEECGSEIHFAEDTLSIFTQHDHHSGGIWYLVHRRYPSYYHPIAMSLKGAYQSKNLLTALKAVLVLQKNKLLSVNVPLFRKACERVEKLTGMYGRWQQLWRKPLVIADGGHNEHGIKYIAEQLEAYMQKYGFKLLHFILGCVKDKDISKILALLPKYARYYFCNADLPRAKPSEELRKEALAFGLKGNAYASVKTAVQAAKRNVEETDMIFIGGSIFVVGEALPHFTEEDEFRWKYPNYKF